MTITSDSKGRVYFGINPGIPVKCEQRLVYYDPADEELKVFEDKREIEIRNIYLSTTDPDGNIWLVGLDGVYRMDTSQVISSTQIRQSLGW